GHHQAQALAYAHGQAQHHGGADQDRRCRTKALEIGRHAQSVGPRPCRSALMLPRRFLSSTRRRRDALVGLVGRRGTGRTAASRISSVSRSSASARLRSWVRWLCAVITSTPSRVSRRPASRSSRARTSSVSDGELRTSKRSCTAVESLLTFCPPGPE